MTMAETTTPAPAHREALLGKGGLVAALTAAVVLPLWLDGHSPEDPAADAEKTYRELVGRIESRADAAEIPALPDPAPLPGEHGRRDLFSPVVEKRPSLAAAPARRKRPRLPTLSGVLIDGPSRQAVLDGEVVSIGDRIRDFVVVAIESGAVTLRRDGSTHRLSMGGGR